jgi:hypothetical protein
MPTNEFLAWAIQPSSNVYTNAEYAALTPLQTGVVNGLADPIAYNSSTRQATFVAAALSQFVADNQSNNVLDNGIVANWEAEFEAALVQYLSTYFVSLPPASNYFVGGTGASDSNNGLTATVSGGSGPWATLAHAFSTIAGYASLASVTINVAPGTYSGISVPRSFISEWIIIGTAGAASTFLVGTSSVSVGVGILAGYGANVLVTGFSVASQYQGVNAQPGSNIALGNLIFSSPTAGVSPCISSFGGYIATYGNATSTIEFLNGAYYGFFGAVGAGAQIVLGFTDGYTTNIADVNYGTSSTTNGTMQTSANGVITISAAQFNQSGTVTSDTYRYSCLYGGGIVADGATISGTGAGNVVSPGWYSP